MPGLSEYEREARDAKLGEGWSAQGPNRIVKVVGVNTPAADDSGSGKHGYVTLERYLVGLTPYQIQRALGLRLGDLKGGCFVYRFRRLPRFDEYTYELTADFPNGEAFDEWAYREEREKWRKDRKYDRKMYREGSSSIPQWKLLKDIEVEGPPFKLLSGVPYPRRL